MCCVHFPGRVLVAVYFIFIGCCWPRVPGAAGAVGVHPFCGYYHLWFAVVLVVVWVFLLWKRVSHVYSYSLIAYFQCTSLQIGVLHHCSKTSTFNLFYRTDVTLIVMNQPEAHLYLYNRPDRGHKKHNGPKTFWDSMCPQKNDLMWPGTCTGPVSTGSRMSSLQLVAR